MPPSSPALTAIWAEWGLKGPGDDHCAGGFVAAQLRCRGPDLVLGPQQGHAAAADDAFLDGGLGGAHGILDAVLLLLQLDLGGRADLEHRNTAGQLGQTLLQLLTVVVGVGVLDLGTDLGDPTVDVGLVSGTLDNRGLVLGDGDLAGLTEQIETGVLQLEADLLGDDLATGEDGHVLQHRLATIAEPGGFHGGDVDRAPNSVDDQGGQSLAVDVLSDDDERLAGLHDLLEHRHEVADSRDLRADQQHVGVLQRGLHTFGVGHEVGGDVALVEPHTLGELEIHAEGVGFLDGDDAVLAHLVDGIGDQLADLAVVGRDGRDLGDLLLGVDLDRHVGDGFGGDLSGDLDTTLE